MSEYSGVFAKVICGRTKAHTRGVIEVLPRILATIDEVRNQDSGNH
jgi:hypothetical protein